MDKKKIILLGGGGHCKSVIDVIEQQGEFEVAGIVDKKELVGTTVLGYEVIGCDDDLEQLRWKYEYGLVSVGHIKSNSLRVKLFEKLKLFGFKIPTIISPFAYVSKHSSVGGGTVVMHGVIINANAKVGKNCIINSKALIEHDVVVKDSVHISTNAVVNGGCVVEENTFFGSGAISKEYVKVSGFVKAGSVVK